MHQCRGGITAKVTAEDCAMQLLKFLHENGTVLHSIAAGDSLLMLNAFGNTQNQINHRFLLYTGINTGENQLEA